MPVVLIILGMIVPTAAAAREGQTRDRLPGDSPHSRGDALTSRRKVRGNRKAHRSAPSAKSEAPWSPSLAAFWNLFSFLARFR
jgi:hypothetical protein